MTHAPIRRAAAAPKGATVTATTPGIDDLAVLLPDWRTHLRARNVAPSTIASYLKVGDNLLGWLREAGGAAGAAGLTREHLEAFLAAPVGPRLSRHGREALPLAAAALPLAGRGRRGRPLPHGTHAAAGRARAAGRHPHRRRTPRPPRRRSRQHLREPPGHRHAPHADRHR